MKTDTNFSSYLAQFFLESKTLQTNVVQENQRTALHIQYIFFFNRAVCEIMWKNIVEPDATDENMAHAHCTWLQTHTHST